MQNYDFRALSDYDFEVLTRDLLQESLKIRLENFKTGKDKGIDLRYSKSFENNVIVQCKHYANSKFSDLYYHLKNSELEKVKRLNPERYILSTSLGLNPDDKDKLVELFLPYIKDFSDIFGRDDLNNLLTLFPCVEEQHFKLWLTSTHILKKLLNSSTYNQSRSDIELIQRKIQLYVETKSFEKSKEILSNSNYAIISGIPGIGKTTLAEILLIYYLDNNHEIIKISHDIEEGFAALKPGSKQVFYYDDFLGQVSLDAKFNKNEDARLIQFINTIENTKDKKFILTTREYILNQAQLLYEKISRFNFNKCVIELDDYNRFDKAKILYNHLFFSQLSREYIAAILNQEGYFRIIDHKHYNPRIISFMTEYTKTKHIPASDYLTFFVNGLDNPTDVWSHAFQYQISDSARLLLLALVSLPGPAFYDDVYDVFSSYYQAELGRIPPKKLFKDALKELEGNFINTTKYNDRIFISFHNPSIVDFIENYLVNNPDELLKLCESFVFFNQLEWLWGTKYFHNSYAYSKRREIIEENWGLFIDILRKTYQSIDCHFVNMSSSAYSGDVIGRIRAETILENRFSFILDIFDEVSCYRTDESLSLFSEPLYENLMNDKGHREPLTMLIQKLNNHALKMYPCIREIIGSIKFYAVNRLEIIEDFNLLSNFIESYGALDKHEIIDAINSNFKGAVEAFLEDDDLNPDDCQIYYDNIIELFEHFELAEDYSQYLDSMQNHIKQLKDNLYDSSDSDDDTRPMRSTEVTASKAEIVYLFDSFPKH